MKAICERLKQKCFFKNCVQQIIFVCGFLLVFTASMVLFIILPSAKELKTTAKDINFLRTDLEKQYKLGQTLKEVSLELKNLNGEIETIENILPPEEKKLALVEALEQISKKNNLSQEINFKKIDGAENKKTQLSINAQGEFKNIMNYLVDIESMEYYINIRNIQLSALPNQGPKNESTDTLTKNMANVLISANTYWE